MSQPVCRTCRRPMLWVHLEHGWKPVDPECREPVAGVIAFNPRTGRGRVVTLDDEPEAWRWAYRGVTFHELHADVCPGAGARPRARRPGQLGLLEPTHA